MSAKRFRLWALTGSLCFLLAGILFVSGKITTSKTTVGPEIPRIVLWSWERPDDLSFLDSNQFGIAYLASELHLQGDNLVVRPRFQPLKLPKDAHLIAVVRIESDRYFAPSLSPAQQAKVSAEITKIAHKNNIAAVQIDFDAKQSERDFYRALINDLRRDWPNNVELTITALASWCISDTWIRDLQIDDAVPMLFRMGVDDNQVRMRLRTGQDFTLNICRNSIGVSSDEPVEGLPPGLRIYIFNPHAWNPNSVQKAVNKLTDERYQSGIGTR